MMSKKAMSCGIAGITFVLILGGSAWGNDFIWTNNGGDRDWSNPANWDEFAGSCGAFLGTVNTPVAGSHYAIVATQGDPNGCPGVWPDPSLPAGDGPIVSSSDGTTGARWLILGNTLTLQPNSYFRTNNMTRVGPNAGTTGSITVNDGAGYYAAWATSGTRECHIGRDGTGALTINGGEFGTRSQHIEVAYNIGSVGEVNVAGGRLFMANTVTNFDTILVIGADGTGTLTQTGGLIELQTDNARLPGLLVGQDRSGGGNASGIVNLNGGFCYSKGFPRVNPNGTAAAGVINIDGGKLGTRDTGTTQADIEALIAAEKIKGTGGSTDLADFHIVQIPAGVTKYTHSGADTAIWVVSSPPAACDVYVSPHPAQNLTVRVTDAPVPIQYTVHNYGKTTTANYSVAKQPDEAWVSLDKTGGSASPNGGTDTVTATINASGLAPGNNYSMNLVFTHDCDPTFQEVRTINVYVPRWSVNPPEPPPGIHAEAIDASIVAFLNCLNPQTYSYTITNLAPTPLSYTVAETDASGNAQDYAWLALDKPGGGPLAQGESDTLTITLTGTGDGPGALGADDSCLDCEQDGYLKFNATGFADVEIRQVKMTETWLGARWGSIGMYLGDVPPHDPAWFPGEVGPCGPGCNFNIIGTQTGTVVEDSSDPDPDYNAQNGYALKIDEGTVENPGPDPIGRNGYASDFNYGEGAGGNNNNINSRLGTTMLARVKVVRDFNMGANLWIRDDNSGSGNSSYGAGCRVRWNSSNRIYEFVNDEGPHLAGNGKADAYHIIRIVDGWGPYGEHVIKVWVDEDEFPEPALEVHGAQAENESAYDAFCIGTFGGGSYSELYYDWVSFTNAGMYGPGEEDSCIGSLLPGACCLPNSTCMFTGAQICEAQGGSLFLPGQSCAEAAGVCGPDPYADFDEDGDVDGMDFAEFQRCIVEVSSGLQIRPGCERWDRNGDGYVDNTIVNSVSDLGAFLACSSGPDVPADVCCDGGVGCP